MSTGPFAYSVDRNSIGTLTIRGTNVDGTPMTPVNESRSGQWTHRDYFRPKSISVPPTVNHWREPTAWFNRGSMQLIRPAGVIITTHTSPHWPLFKQVCQVSNGFGVVPVGISLPLFDSQKYIDVTITKALLKLKNQHVNLANAFGERKEAVKMFESFSRRVVTDVAGFKQSLSGHRLVKQNPREFSWKKLKRMLVKDLPGDLHNHWLELIYGWVPFMSDLFGSCEALAYREADGNAYRATVVSSIRQQDSFAVDRWSALANAPRSGSPSFCDCGWDVTVRTDNVVHTSLTYALENPFLRSLAQMGITNPAVLLWELTRLSFVLDWLLPIGNYLSVMDATLGWKFMGGTSSVLQKAHASFVPYIEQKEDPWHNDRFEVSLFSSSPPSWDVWDMSRKLYHSSPLPRMPRLKNPLSGIHTFNAVALLRGAFS